MEKFLKNSKGITLVEILASTVLITLILTTFLMVFAQAAKTNMTSGTIIESTYTAQTEMEKIYGLSKTTAPDFKDSALNAQYGTSKTVSQGDIEWNSFTKVDASTNERIEIRIEKTASEKKMTRVVIEVYEETKTHPSAKMENVLIWEVTP